MPQSWRRGIKAYTLHQPSEDSSTHMRGGIAYVTVLFLFGNSPNMAPRDPAPRFGSFSFQPES
ncbi:hypothetical protein BF29_2778 [Heyndrickxia coagulans DSM 1 = ATCC 7050]|uniref:Uncharacterized protein n=1 Tax=Heyndrickxia coagulans DSM 1 = ATCC 7050 TaxID=1121088 RepID=A0A8B4BXP3_HEYCO|nr:hypothetical protein BF29_2778 [Heyndrickxia coagulans DSM 1 = ATCC 7050]SHF30311.1 hypothetical protein SAMN02745208_01759 [Heyndrickxia coagulans DSM 1 = ATCC 7050]